MDNPYCDKSEYAVSTWIYETAPFHDVLEDIGRHGFKDVELWGDTVHFDPRVGLDRPLIKKWLHELGLSVHSIHGPFRNFGEFSDKEEFRQYRQELLRKTIDDCSEFRVSIMVVHCVDRYEYNYSRDELHIVRDNLGELCEYGRKRGVRIALENIPDGSRKDEISCSLQEHIRNYPGLGLYYCLDIGHVGLSGADLFEEIDAAAPNLITTHIHNNDGLRDTHKLPDDGIIDWSRVRSYLREKGYTGKFVLEVHGGSDPFSVMNNIDRLFSL